MLSVGILSFMATSKSLTFFHSSQSSLGPPLLAMVAVVVAAMEVVAMEVEAMVVEAMAVVVVTEVVVTEAVDTEEEVAMEAAVMEEAAMEAAAMEVVVMEVEEDTTGKTSEDHHISIRCWTFDIILIHSTHYDVSTQSVYSSMNTNKTLSYIVMLSLFIRFLLYNPIQE